jgi:hypothetical protein
MPRITPARVLLAATLAAATLPAAAEASVIDLSLRGYEYRADAGERNSLIVSQEPDGSRVFTDSVPLRIEVPPPSKFGSPAGRCRSRTRTTVVCDGDYRLEGIATLDGSDSVFYGARVGTEIDLGAGNDTVFGGVRPSPPPLGSDLHNVQGGPGVDTLTYRLANAAATASIAGGMGEAGADGVLIISGIEELEGSRFDDTLTGSDAETGERFRGLGGNDRLIGLAGPDFFDEGALANGSDFFNGGSGFDLVDYGKRSNRVEVTLNSVSRNDGEAGENDLADPNVNSAAGGAGDDTLIGSAGFNELSGGAGQDTIRAGDGDDRIFGGDDPDTLLAEGGGDTVISNDGEPDTVRCGTGEGIDVLTRDAADTDVADCESQTLLGRLAMKSGTLRAKAGKVVRLELAWTHPRAWRDLRSLTVRLRDAQATVAEITIDPKRRRAVDDEKALADVIGRRVVVAGARRTVRAALPLRIDRKLAGRRLEVEIEATDAAGNRQLETGAASIRVAG